jgi:FixJ family two-component response regulator
MPEQPDQIMFQEIVDHVIPRERQTFGDLVCVVDHDEEELHDLERLFRSERMKVEAFASAGDYLAHGTHAGPTCVVLDILMPDIDGLTLQAALADRGEQVVCVSGQADVPTCARAMKAGAVDFLTKPVDGQMLLSAVSVALERARASYRLRLEQETARAVLDSLTGRELEVMRGVLSGMLNKQIASDLGIAEKTVKIHRGRVMRKTGCVSVPGLIRLAQRAQAMS